MGYSFSRDGLCKECGYFTQERCDSCGRYICPEHIHFSPVSHSKIIEHVLCKDCTEVSGPKWFMHRTRLNIKQIRLAHTKYMTVPDT
jgi:hypothetical protein